MGMDRPGNALLLARNTVTMVRHEVGVLPTVLDHLEAPGVEHVLVSHNGSADGTLDLLEERAADGRLYLARDVEPA
jgi:hypothetical protein